MERESAGPDSFVNTPPRSSVQPSLLCPGPANWSLINLMELVLYQRRNITKSGHSTPAHKQPADIDVSEPEPGSHRSADV